LGSKHVAKIKNQNIAMLTVLFINHVLASFNPWRM